MLGTIFAGGVHDYLSGMISVREDGKSISEVVGIYMGPAMLAVMRVFSVVLLVLVGTVFMTGPAMLLTKLTAMDFKVWLFIVLAYYFLATLLPIDAIIARFYPLFGACLILMALGIMVGMFTGVGGHVMPEMVLANLHPKAETMPIWPLMFITVACGAISGFHATQSPIMSRCLKDERLGRPVFYGAMVAEGIIALIWAAAGMTFYDGTAGLAASLAKGGPGGAVYDICVGFLGTGVGAILGFGNTLGFIDYQIIWRYFSWSNQTLAMIVLWAGAMYLAQNKRNYWICAVPATFMSAVSCTYFMMAGECMGLIELFKNNKTIGYPVGLIFAAGCLALFLTRAKRAVAQAAKVA